MCANLRHNTKILVLTPFYDIFVKESVDAVAKYVDTMTVAVHHNYLSELSRYLPFSGYLDHVRRYTKDKILDLRNKPNNVHIKLFSLIYFIPDGKNKYLGDKITKKLNNLINTEGTKFDLIHANITWPQGYVAVKLGQLYNIPVVITIHASRDRLLREYNSGNEKIYWTWKNADALIRVNQKDVPLLKEYNENVFHVPNGFNPKKFFSIEQSEAREILKLTTEKKIIFTFSYLSERKGFQHLIASMNEIIKVRKDILCFIGGSGPMRQKLESQILSLGLQDYIKLVGFVPDEKLVYWLNAADLFVLPSLSEGNPTVMFEALGSGLPFVGTRVGGVPEIITSEDYGLLCEPANPKDLLEKILIGLDKEWDGDKILEYAQQFTWENIAKKIMEIYKLLVEGDILS